MGHALPKETQKVVERAARLVDAGRRMDAGDTFTLRNVQRRIVDLEELERLLSDPSVTVSEACCACGIHRNTLYHRLPKDSALRTVFNRAMQTRRLSKQVTMIRKVEKRKTEPKPARVGQRELLARKLPDFNEAWPDEVKAKWLEAFGKIADEAPDATGNREAFP